MCLCYQLYIAPFCFYSRRSDFNTRRRQQDTSRCSYIASIAHEARMISLNIIKFHRHNALDDAYILYQKFPSIVADNATTASLPPHFLASMIHCRLISMPRGH